MQKILDPQLDGAEDAAKARAEYTWQKDEIAWFFDSNYRDVFKVQFTGEHWIVGNKWRYHKIYQYRYLDSSGNHDLARKDLENDGIAHVDEELFYTTRDEAITRGFRYIEVAKANALLTFDEDMKKLSIYELTE